MLSLSGLSVSACSSVLRRAARDTLPESPHLEAICFYEMFTIPAPDSYCYWSHYWWSTGRGGFQGTGMWRCLCMKGQRQKTNAFPALALLCIFWNTGFLITSHNMRVLKRSSQRQYFVSPIKITIHFFFTFVGNSPTITHSQLPEIIPSWLLPCRLFVICVSWEIIWWEGRCE